jgi:hypothetical protein
VMYDGKTVINVTLFGRKKGTQDMVYSVAHALTQRTEIP